MTEKDLYFKLKVLESEYNLYKQNALTNLSADKVQQLIELTKDVNLVYPSTFVRTNFSCSSCVLSAFTQLITIFDRLSPLYQIEEGEDNEGKL